MAKRTYGKSIVVSNELTYLFVGSGMIKNIVEVKIVGLQKRSQINF